MKRPQSLCSRNAAILALVLSLVGLAALGDFSSAQVKKGMKRPLETRHMMSAIVKNHCGALKKALDAGPKTDEDWDQVVLHAAILNESSFMLMADGRCPDGTWAQAATKTLRGCSQAVLDAAGKKNVESAKTAFGALTKSCGACHKVHKKKKK